MSNSNPNVAFQLRLRPYRKEHDARTITVTAFDDAGWDSAGRIKMEYEVKHGKDVIFPRGTLYGAVHGASDGIRAKEHALACVEMKPGDTDADYFAGYTPEQLEWVAAHGDAISMIRSDRYCDPETGDCRR